MSALRCSVTSCDGRLVRRYAYAGNDRRSYRVMACEHAPDEHPVVHEWTAPATRRRFAHGTVQIVGDFSKIEGRLELRRPRTPPLEVARIEAGAELVKVPLDTGVGGVREFMLPIEGPVSTSGLHGGDKEGYRS